MMSRKLLPSGTILNRYRIEKIIGEGGFGVTYLAMEPSSQIYVAIKEYFPKSFARRQIGNTIVPNRDAEEQRVFKWGLKRFLDEAKVLARLDHPSVIKVQKYFEMHGTAYLVMEYCDAKPLDKFVHDNSVISPLKLFQIYSLLLNALEHVHQHGIIHGDLKPSNVLVLNDGTPVLVDFGSARQEMLRLAVGQVSDGYSPPEFYGTSDNVGPWSDIYGLGATFYKLITGVKVPIATDRSKSDSYIPAANWITDGYSSAFLELIDNSLRLSTSDRPQSISSLKRLLPDIKNLSSGFSINKDLLGKAPKLETYISTTLHWKAVVIVSVILVIILGVFASLNRPAVAVLEVDAPKVEPIVIDDEPVVIENPVVTPKNVVQMPTGNAALQQALTYLTRVSSSPEISWYSIPQTEQASRSFIFARNEIDKKVRLAFTQKKYTNIKNSDEYVLKDLLLPEINSLEYIATDAKCNSRPIGPVELSCTRSGRDFRCRFIDLSVKYENMCLATFTTL